MKNKGMSKDTDKLAAQMRNLKPSKASREAGLDAAMAAFSKEFAGETTSAKADESANLEKTSTSSQGLADAPRPTGKSTTSVRATSRSVETMAKFKTAFNFKPQTMMMAGTCSAALIAAMIVVPNMGELAPMDQIAEPAPVTAKSAPAEAAPIVEAPEITETMPVVEMPADDLDTKSDVIVMEGTPVPAPALQVAAEVEEDEVVVTGARQAEVKNSEPAPSPQGGITSVNGLLNDGLNRGSATPEEAVIREYRAALQKKENVELFVAKQSKPSNLSTPPAPPQLAVSPGFVAPSQPSASNTLGRSRVLIPDSNTSAPSRSPIEKFGNLTVEQGPAEFKTVTETIVVQEASTELVTIPAVYETVKETIVAQEAATELIVTPTEYEWVEGKIDGSVVELITTPPDFETVSETVVVQPASVEYVSVPAVYETVVETIVIQEASTASDGSIIPPVTKTETRRVVKTPASFVERTVPAVTKQVARRVVKTPAAVVERVVPYEQKDGKTRVPVKPATVTEKPVPAVTKEVTRRVLKTPARTVERARPAVPRTIERQVLVKPSKYYLRDDDGNVVREFENRDAFEKYKSNLTTVVSETPVSTFSVDVDTAS